MSQVRKIEKLICAGERVIYEVGRQPRQGDEILTPLKVKSIGESAPKGPGDCWLYEVMLEDDSAIRVYNMDRVFISKPMSIMPVGNKLIT